MYKRQEHDVVLARFEVDIRKGMGSSISGTIRYVKRKGKFYRIDDLNEYKFDCQKLSNGHSHRDFVVEVDRKEIISKVREAIEVTLNWSGNFDSYETYEIWINRSIASDLK